MITIVNQKGNKVSKYFNVWVEDWDNSIHGYTPNGIEYSLGEYSTIEKTQKVFEKIIEVMSIINLLKNLGYDPDAFKLYDTKQLNYALAGMFAMPQDSEVE